MKKLSDTKKIILTAVLISATLPFSVFAQTSESDIINETDGTSANTENENGFDFDSAFSGDIDSKEESSKISVSGILRTEYGVDSSDGNLKRAMVQADVELGYVSSSTEIKIVLRGENDSLRNTTVLFKNKDDYEKSREESASCDADDINSDALESNRFEIQNSDTYRAYLREGYVSQNFNTDMLFLKALNVKAGSIIYTWGNADETKPVDIINHQDMSYSFMKPLQERKYGELSINPTFFFTDKIFFEAVISPWFEPDETASSEFYDYQLEELDGYAVAPVMPDQSVKNFTYAARLGASLFDIDMHANYFHGPDRTPTARPVTSGIDVTNPANPVYDGTHYVPEYRTIQMFGFDFQKALFAGISARGEFAYFTDGKYVMENTLMPIYSNGIELKGSARDTVVAQLAAAGVKVSDLKSPVERDIFEYAAGFDDMDLFGIDDLYLNFQVYQNIIIGDMNEINADRYTTWIITKLEYALLRQKLKLTGKYLNDPQNSSGAVNLQTSYNVSDSCTVAAGTWQFYGEKDNTFGQYKDDGFVYMNAVVNF